MRYCILMMDGRVEFVTMPSGYMYQLVALLRRLHKEIDKLTAASRPALPVVLGECSELELHDENSRMIPGLTYLTHLEQQFANVKEENYPLISLLTEIRALHAQLEYLAEEGVEG
ncbi:hypothetical protein [Aneurinibacillus terranovensis]|uniref:hypothetical protein n=1 Tax=Aneurinibacillus terranovensis TaxID=278991 RepID=UPI00041E8ECD|nr:hypothetical protein [Aneurinibacillus terranovensis]